MIARYVFLINVWQKESEKEKVLPIELLMGGPMKKVFGFYLRPYYLRMFGGFVIKFLGTIMDLLIPWVLAYIIDNVVPTGKLSHVFLWGFAMLLFSVCALLGNIFANRFAAKVAELSMRRIRKDLFVKVSELSCGQLDEFTESSLVTRLTADTYNVHNAIGMVQRLGVRAPILLVGGICVTLTLDKVLALVLVSMLPFLSIIVVTVSKKGIPLYSKQQKAVDGLICKLRENITGVRVIRALSQTELEKERFDEINKEVVKKETTAAVTMGITNPAMNFILNMGWVLVILIGASRVNAGVMEGGKIVAFLTYFTIILNAMLMVTRLFVRFSQASASAGRIMQVIDSCTDWKMVEECYGSEEVTAGKDTVKNDNGEKEPDFIRFEDVSFSYIPGKTILKNISFSLKKGESLGIIGATGSGKTTIINLLMRFYEADSGKIFIDEKNVMSMTEEELRKRFGVAFQNDTMFEDTVYENISLYRHIDDKRVMRAAEDADIASHIEKMEGGLKAGVAIKGANLSGGQKQRMLIARALAGNPEILVLDDSSSALDYKTDAKVRAAIREHYADTTTIIIAQRVSSVMNCDKIILLEKGQIAGYGDHETLLSQCEEYREISKMQLEA